MSVRFLGTCLVGGLVLGAVAMVAACAPPAQATRVLVRQEGQGGAWTVQVVMPVRTAVLWLRNLGGVPPGPECDTRCAQLYATAVASHLALATPDGIVRLTPIRAQGGSTVEAVFLLSGVSDTVQLLEVADQLPSAPNRPPEVIVHRAGQPVTGLASLRGARHVFYLDAP